MNRRKAKLKKKTKKYHDLEYLKTGGVVQIPRVHKLTDQFLKSLPLVEGGLQLMIRDSELPGYYVILGSTFHTLVNQSTGPDARSRRVVVGRVGVDTAAEARKKARKVQQQIRDGGDPVADKRKLREKARLSEQTLRQAFENYIGSRSLKPGTLYDYQKYADRAWNDWLDVPLSQITRDMIERRHRKLRQQIIKRWKELGRLEKLKMPGAYADSAMQLLSYVLNHAAACHDGPQLLLPNGNPVRFLGMTGMICKPARRETIIDEPDLPQFLSTVEIVRHMKRPGGCRVVADYLDFVLYTGLRRNEAATLRWSQIDWERKILIIKNTKNQKPHVLPLTPELLEILQRRKDDTDAQILDGRWVFQSLAPNRGRGHLSYPEPIMKIVKEKSGLEFTLHDLRRTFITACMRLGVGEYQWKRLLNHSTGDNVTYGYVVANVEDLREAMEKVSSEFSRLRAKGRGWKIQTAS